MHAQAPTAFDVAPFDALQQLEDYVRRRITAFAKLFAAEVAPSLKYEQVDQITQRLLAGQGAVVGGSSQAAAGQQGSIESATAPTAAKLVYKHDCRALGCRDDECLLCQNNPEKMCERNFQRKYLVGDLLRAKCGAHIRLELVDEGGRVISNSIYSNIDIELNIVDGNAFRDRGGDVQQLSDGEFKSCIKYTKKEKADSLLCNKSLASNVQRVVVRLINGVAELPDLTLSESSEALLAGRRPPYQLVAWLSGPYGQLSSEVRYGVSDAFVVATRRVRQANKLEIPLTDDHVSKIEHIGRETVRKLADLRVAAMECGLKEVAAALNEKTARIETVGQLQNLVRLAENNTQLVHNLQTILKLPREKWVETAAHAMSAVTPDFRHRVWYPPNHNSSLGLVFGCKFGAPMIDASIGLAQRNQQDGSMKVITEDKLDAASLAVLAQLKLAAVKHWTEPKHPGWSVIKEADAAAAAAVGVPAGAWGSAITTNAHVNLPPPAAAMLPVAVLAPKPTAAAAAFAAMMNVSAAAGRAAAAAAGQNVAVLAPAVGSKRTADVAGLGSTAAAADHDDVDHHPAAKTDTKQNELPSTAVLVAISELARKALMAPASATTDNANSNSAAAAKQTTAAAVTAAAHAASTGPSGAAAKPVRVAGDGLQGSHDNNSSYMHEARQKTIPPPSRSSPRTSPESALRSSPSSDLSGRLGSYSGSGLTGLDAVAAAAAAAEAGDAAATLKQQQQQQISVKGDRAKSGATAGPAVVEFSATAIAASIVKRLTSSRASVPVRAAAAVQQH